MNSNQRRRQTRKMMKRDKPASSEQRYIGHLEVRGEGDAATIEAALSSETPVRRFFGNEVLEHTAAAIDMSRAAKGLPLLFSHDQRDLVGRVRDIRLDDDRKLRGTLHFAKSVRAQEKRQEVLDGMLTDISLGYTIEKTNRDEKTERTTATRWTPLETSLVTVPADPAVGINRGDPTVDTTPTPTQDPPASPPPASHELAIRQAFEPFITRNGVADLQARAISANQTPAEAMAALLSHVGMAGEPEPGTAAGITAGETDKEKFHRGAENAILVRSGAANEDERREGAENPFTSFSMVELARAWAAVNNIDVAGMGAPALLSRAIDPGTANLDTTDFAAILENVMNKGLFRGFDEAAVTWDQWCSTNGVSDFKAYTRPGLSHFTSLALVAENAAIADGIRNDKKEGGALGTYARKFSITREAMINDDLSAFSDNARAMGMAANRTVDEQVIGTLETNAVMGEDAVALFSVATHANLITTGGAPDEAAITVGKVAMSAQVDQNSVPLGIRPAFSLAPIELEDTMIKLANAEFSPDGSANPFEPNAVRGTFIPIATHLLTDKNGFYLFGPRGTTLEVNFLGGNRNPSMERDTGWSTFAMHWKVWLDFDVLPLDWRACFLNEGGV